MNVTEMGKEKKKQKPKHRKQPPRTKRTYEEKRDIFQMPKSGPVQIGRNHRLNYERAMFPPCTPVGT